MNTTGTAFAICATCFWRPMRCCSAEKSSGRSSRNASTSPSRTVPSGRWVAAAAISGKRWVISSSPRDHRWMAPPRFTSCARMPSHFHSRIQSARLAERRRILVQRRGEKEGIGARLIDVGGFDRQHRAEPLGRRRPFAHQARGDGGDRNAGRLRERPHDERLRHADAQLAGDHLQQHETLQPVERRPPLGDLAALLVRGHVAKREDPRLDPLRQRQRRRCSRRPAAGRGRAPRSRRRRRPPNTIPRAATRAGACRPASSRGSPRRGRAASAGDR